jgi:hypothetical protein
MNKAGTDGIALAQYMEGSGFNHQHCQNQTTTITKKITNCPCDYQKVTTNWTLEIPSN